MDGARRLKRSARNRGRKNGRRSKDSLTRRSLRNEAETATDVVFLEFNFTEIADPSKRTTRQFVCAAHIRPKEKADIHVFSTFGPSDTISVADLAGNPEALFRMDVTIDRIDTERGAIIQRQDWNFKNLRSAIERVTSTPWGDEMCRGL